VDLLGAFEDFSDFVFVEFGHSGYFSLRWGWLVGLGSRIVFWLVGF